MSRQLLGGWHDLTFHEVRRNCNESLFILLERYTALYFYRQSPEGLMGDTGRGRAFLRKQMQVLGALFAEAKWSRIFSRLAVGNRYVIDAWRGSLT